MIPKMHWLLHFRKHFERYGLLIACFVTERYHRNPKRYATDMTNTSKSASKNVLKEVVCLMMSRVQSPNAFNFSVGLVQSRPASKNVRAAVFFHLEMADDGTYDVDSAFESRFNRFGTCKKGDVVLFDNDGALMAAKVLLHVEVAGTPLSLVSVWVLKSIDRDAGYSEWHSSFNPQIFDTGDIVDTVVTSELGDNTTALLLPCDFR